MKLTADEAKELIEYCASFEKIDDIFDSEKGFYCFAKFSKNALTILFDDIEFMKICEKNSFYEFFNNVLCSSASNFQLSILKNFASLNDKIFDSYKTLSHNEKKFFFLFSVLKLINKFIPSIKFRKILIEKNGLKTHLEMVKMLNEENIFFNKEFFSVIIFNINWLSKLADDNKKIWTDLDGVLIIANYMRNFKFFKTYAIMILSNVADDKDLESLAEFSLAIEVFTQMTIACFYQSNRVLEQEFDNSEEIIKFDIKNITDDENKCFISITGLLLTLYKISINENRKLEIFKQSYFKECLFEIIKTSNDAEKQHALQLLITLCFDNDILSEVRQENELINFIENLLLSETIKYIQLKKACRNFLWIIKKKEDNVKNSNKKHIMISYNSATRDLCLKIRNFLVSKELDVWIDMNDINGSSCDSMAKAVEDAEFVLICVTEKYRNSYACQSEAKYAYKLKKNIIPCIMEKGYHSVEGWLGFIISDKIFVDFTKYELEDCFNRLLKQIEIIRKNSNEQKKNESNKGKSNEQDLTDWDHLKTEEWFLKNSFEEIFNVLKPIDGKGLKQLYEIHTHTPEFFYKSLTASNSVSLTNLINFTLILQNLIGK